MGCRTTEIIVIGTERQKLSFTTGDDRGSLQGMRMARKSPEKAALGYLDGQMLIAMPSMICTAIEE